MMQSIVNLVYPPQCMACDNNIEANLGLCGTCWRDVNFVGGSCCNKCGTPLMGEDVADTIYCDDCLVTARPWAKGRTTLLYTGLGRRLVLGLKHGDRTDLVPGMANWIARAAKTITPTDAIVVPVPLHWTRLFSRKYNQSSLLSRHVAKNLGLPHQPRALVRTKRTKPMNKINRSARFELLDSAITYHRKFGTRLAGRNVLLVDDVMTSGATLAACTEACYAAGAHMVCVVTLARVAKDA